ncbi:MAG: SRPBCC domain-containing protein [Candidatus Competibacteraceae bacterium]|nr:SRPBCC domain-containing protein [Candidatus Competibacteraceae bacterium]
MNELQNKAFELTITRIFDAPRERVWQAWTDKEQVIEWLSPKGFYVKEHKGKIAEGEHYRERMISPAGNDSVFFGEYLELSPPEKLVFTHIWENDECGIPEVRTVCTVLLETMSDGKTKMIFTQTGLSSEESRDSHESGWSECFDKLSTFLKEIK